MSFLNHFPGWEQIDGSWVPAEKTEAALRDVMARCRSLEAYLEQEKHRRMRRLRWWGIAAAAVILLLAVPMVTIHLVRRSAVNSSPIAYVQRATSSGEREEVILPDQSKVLLNAESVLIYPERFDGLRKVYLSGEAIFDVTASDTEPFLVETPEISLRVHGTKFDVNAYPHDPSVRATLSRGRVAVWPNDAPSRIVELLPEQQFILDRSSGSITTEKVSLQESFSWETGELCFHSSSIRQIVRTLERQYGIDVRLMTTRYDNVVLTARFIHGETVDEVMTSLCAVVPGMHYGWDGTSLYIK